MRAAQKLMLPILLCWPMTSELDTGSTAVEVESSCWHSITFRCPTDGQCGRMVLMWKCIWSKNVSLNSFMCNKMAPTDIPWCLLNADGDQTVDVSTVRWWVERFSSGDSNVKYKPHSGRQIFTSGMQALVHHWWKHIPNGGNYVKK